MSRKTSGNAGCLAESGGRGGSPGTPAVPGRGPLRTHGSYSSAFGPPLAESPSPLRPTVDHGYERPFVYVYGAVSPLQGELEWMICPEMNTVRMSAFLRQVSLAHPGEFMIMIVDGASSHRSKELGVPDNMRLVALPGYSPELNPQEQVWDELREKEFPNRVFADLESVIAQLHDGLPRLASNQEALRSLTAWPWIISLNLKAN